MKVFLPIFCCIVLTLGCSSKPQSVSLSPSPSPQTQPTPSLEPSSNLLLLEGKVLRGERLTKLDLEGLSQTDLERLRYTPSARHGSRYSSAELQAYFNNRPWYKAISNYENDLLTQTDRANEELVLSVQELTRGNTAQANATPTQSSATLSLDEQAHQEAERYVRNKYKRCGESFFTKYEYVVGPAQGAMEIYEFRDGPTINVSGSAPQLSPAERLNNSQAGVEWDGQIRVHFGLARKYLKARASWDKWNDLVPTTMQPAVKMTKRNGRWQFSDSSSAIASGAREAKVTCDAIPQ